VNKRRYFDGTLGLTYGALSTLTNRHKISGHVFMHGDEYGRRLFMMKKFVSEKIATDWLEFMLALSSSHMLLHDWDALEFYTRSSRRHDDPYRLLISRQEAQFILQCEQEIKDS
jgi:hypothetical protein